MGDEKERWDEGRELPALPLAISKSRALEGWQFAV
jgi:hypothetical protein